MRRPTSLSTPELGTRASTSRAGTASIGSGPAHTTLGCPVALARGAQSTAACLAAVWPLAAIRHAFGRRETEQGMPAARPRPLPRARTPHSGHIRDRCRGQLRLATPPVSRNLVILTPLRLPYQVSIRCAIFNFVFWRLDARRGGHRGVAAVRAGDAVTRGVLGDR